MRGTSSDEEAPQALTSQPGRGQKGDAYVALDFLDFWARAWVLTVTSALFVFRHEFMLGPEGNNFSFSNLFFIT